MHPVRRSYAFSLFFAALLLCGFINVTDAQQRQHRPMPRPATETNLAAASIPSPRSVLGFDPGDDRKLAGWSQIIDYFERLDRASDRVEVERIGDTTLHRPLIAAFISAPENIRNLAKYKEIQRRLADPRLIRSDAERDQLIHDGKTVVVISCSIHSTEIVASQMSMQLAYELATAQGDS